MATARTVSDFLGDPRAAVLAAMAVVGIALWWLMFAMPQMDMPRGWSGGVIASTAVMWVLMMLAMMLPAMAPVMAIYTGLAAKEDHGVRLALRVLTFFAGYFALWAVVSVALALAQLGLRDTAYFTQAGTMATPIAASVLLIVAGLYQLTALKEACLRHCRSPMAFLLAHWREGIAGGFPMGLRHGLFCVGCCVVLMGLMFVLGAMNPWWMAAIAAYFVAEKLLPAAETWSRCVGFALIFLGIGVMVASLSGPEFT